LIFYYHKLIQYISGHKPTTGSSFQHFLHGSLERTENTENTATGEICGEIICEEHILKTSPMTTTSKIKIN
jgi:hypothetical protein